MAVLTLETERLALDVDAAFGGRVTRLLDKASGRDWLVPDDVGQRDAGAAVYDARSARGWDECFPTVAPVDGTPHGWPGRLRDHGLLWGVPTECRLEDNRLTTVWAAPRYRLVRSIEASGAELALTYELSNLGADGFDYLYSQHMLLATRPGDMIELNGVDAVTDIDTGITEAWPIAALAAVQGIESGIARKLYAPVQGAFEARIGDDRGGITVGWDGAHIPALGLWLDYGGWPETGKPVHQIAIEPTTALAHGLGAGAGRHLASGESHRWHVHMRVETR